MTLPNAGDLDYLDHLARESARFAQAVGEVPADTAVPSCPDWTAADLLWHLGQVQWFWGTVVRDRLDGGAAQALIPDRPATWTGLQEFYHAASRELGLQLAAATPDTPAWTWAQDQTVGFIRRRQAHEALIHRIDAELTAGCRTPMVPPLSADGVDEALRIMYGGGPEWASFTPRGGQPVRIQATDTGQSWLAALGRFAGTDPGDQTSFDELGMQIADSDSGAEAATTISGDAADLNCWLWHRPPLGAVDRAGDAEALAAFEASTAAGIN